MKKNVTSLVEMRQRHNVVGNVVEANFVFFSWACTYPGCMLFYVVAKAYTQFHSFHWQDTHTYQIIKVRFYANNLCLFCNSSIFHPCDNTKVDVRTVVVCTTFVITCVTVVLFNLNSVNIWPAGNSFMFSFKQQIEYPISVNIRYFTPQNKKSHYTAMFGLIILQDFYFIISGISFYHHSFKSI